MDISASTCFWYVIIFYYSFSPNHHFEIKKKKQFKIITVYCGIGAKMGGAMAIQTFFVCFILDNV